MEATQINSLLDAISELAEDLGYMYDAASETRAEFAMSWVCGGGSSQDASAAYAMHHGHGGSSAIDRVEAELSALEARLDAEFPVQGPEAPAVEVEEAPF